MALKLLDSINLGYIWTRSLLPTYRRWHGKVKLGDIRVFYGFDTVPTPGEKAFGGIIKAQDLAKVFPNRPCGANILYLISSALPYFAVRMARLARRAGAGIVVNQNGVAYPGWFGQGWKRHNRPMRALLRLADHVIYQSRFCKISADRFLGKPRCSWEILYNPVDTQTYIPPAGRQLSMRTPKLLIAGSHWSRYRPRVALEVLKRILPDYPRARLIIAGGLYWEKDQNKSRSQLINDMNRLGVAEYVDVLGPYSQVDAVGIFQRSDILLHTKYNDPCPRLVVEALACGLPVVYSATGGVPELVGKHAGVGVPGKLDWQRDHPPDSVKMAEGVLKVLADRQTFAYAARRRAVARFDGKPWLQRHKTIFATICSQGPG